MDKVRVGMIGCGGFQRHRMGNLLKVKGAEIVALCDPSDEQIEKTKETHPVTEGLPVYHDHQEMLARTPLDAVFIATPHTQHVTQILDSLTAGCHVCCEKPLVTSVEHAHQIIAARDQAKKVGMVSYQRHFQPEFRYIRREIETGVSGPVQFISALQGQGWLRGTVGTWRQQHSLSGGGQLNDSGSHLLDIILWTTGQSVESVSGYCENFNTEVDINSALSVRFKSGALGTFSVVGNGIGWHEDVTFFCEEKIYYIRSGKLTIQDRSNNRFQAEHLAGGGTPDQNFIDAIQGKAECESPFECGLEVIRLTEAAWKSAYELNGNAAKVLS